MRRRPDQAAGNQSRHDDTQRRQQADDNAVAFQIAEIDRQRPGKQQERQDAVQQDAGEIDLRDKGAGPAQIDDAEPVKADPRQRQQQGKGHQPHRSRQAEIAQIGVSAGRREAEQQGEGLKSRHAKTGRLVAKRFKEVYRIAGRAETLKNCPMPRSVLPVTAVLAALLLTACAPPMAADTAESPSSYLTPAILPPTLLPPPPAEGSAGWQANMDAVVAVQAQRTDGDVAALIDEQHLRLALMTDVLTADPRPESAPAVATLLQRVLATTGAVAEADKQFWHTRRPYLADPRVHLLVDPIDASPGYPSGHTTTARVLAEVLGLLYPNQLANLRARAQIIAWHRIMAGVHEPADIEGGQLLAMQIVGALLNDAAFQRDLAAAQAAIAANP